MRSAGKLRAAVAQVDVTPRDVDANFDKHLDFVKRAKAEGCELLMFPELSLTGYDVGAVAPDVSMSLEDPRLMSLAEAAGEMHVVVGLVEAGYAAQFFNSAAVLHRGDLVFFHRKLNLANYGNLEEGKFFATGRYVEAFEITPELVGSVLICADVWNPGLVHLAALHGATILMAPINSAHDAVSGDFSNPDGWETVLRFYAMIYGLPILMANRVGKEGELHFWGGSRILDPHGQPLAQAGEDEEALLAAEIDYEQIKRARFQLPTVRDSNLDLIHRELERLNKHVGVPVRLRSR